MVLVHLWGFGVKVESFLLERPRLYQFLFLLQESSNMAAPCRSCVSLLAKFQSITLKSALPS